MYRLALPSDSSYIPRMKSLTIRLPDALALGIERESTARRLSKSDIVRERLDQPGVNPVVEPSLRSILEQAWSAKVSSRARRFRSAKKQKLAEAIRAKKLRRR